MKSKLGIAFIILCIVSFFLYKQSEKSKNEATKEAQETLIEGVVVDAFSQEPIQGVEVAIAGTNPRSRSDENGKFVVYGTSSDNYIFKHSAYKSIQRSGNDLKIVRMNPKLGEENNNE